MVVVFVGLIAFVFALLMLLRPDVIWMITESWKSYASEPSDLYRLSVRIGGGILGVASLVLIILPFI